MSQNVPLEETRVWPKIRPIVAVVVTLVVALFVVVFSLKVGSGPMTRAATPPASIETLDDFVAWRGHAATSVGKVSVGGATYTVVMTVPARKFASGPAAYMFDSIERYADWTSDMGDFPTRNLGVRLNAIEIADIQPAPEEWHAASAPTSESAP